VLEPSSRDDLNGGAKKGPAAIDARLIAKSKEAFRRKREGSPPGVSGGLLLADGRNHECKDPQHHAVGDHPFNDQHVWQIVDGILVQRARHDREEHYQHAVAESLCCPGLVFTPADVHPNEQDGIEQVPQPDQRESVLERIRRTEGKATARMAW